MSELIDRQAAIDAVTQYAKFLWKTYHETCNISGMIDAIDGVPTASPWHRVEDEMPNDGDWAIFTNGKVVSVERFKVDAYNHFFPASEWFDFEDAIAWMPLPEPPKEDA